MKRILLTGGTGFIGSHTCLSLLEQENEVLILDSNINSSSRSLEGILKILSLKKIFCKNKLKFIRGDINDENLLKKIFHDANVGNKPIDGVIHFAGLKSVKDSINKPLSYWETNVSGTINLVKVMDMFNCRKIIFSSSASIYGLQNKGLLREDSSIDPITPYGLTKASIEKFLKDVFTSSEGKWNIINLRYFNPIGAHCSGLIGEEITENTNNIFPLLIESAFSSTKGLQIYGNDWDTFDGTCVRDFIHVMDVADAHIRAFKFLSDKYSLFLSLNIGTGKGTSLMELIKTFEKVNRLNVEYIFSKRRVGDTPFVVADNFKAKKILGWEPSRTLEDMCRDGWKWKKINPYGYSQN